MANPKKTFSKLYDKNIDQIYRFIYFKVESEEIAQDICAEAFTRGWEAFKEKHDQIDNPRAFLYRIAHNLVADHHKARTRVEFVSVENISLSDPDTDIKEMSEVNSDFNNIKKALEGINEDYKEIIVMHYLNDLQIPEIAQALDKSEGAVRVQLHRAIKSLRKTLEKNIEMC